MVNEDAKSIGSTGWQVMTRDKRVGASYWNEWIDFYVREIGRKQAQIQRPAGDPSYRPQYIFELANNYLEMIIERYSRGDAIECFAKDFFSLLDAWEMAERAGMNVWTPEQQLTRHSWKLNLDHYIFCFWLVGLALALDIPDSQWQKLLSLIGNEGEDILLDRVIASRQHDRRVGETLCFPKAYQRLLLVLDADFDERPGLLRDFVVHWYPSLRDAGNPGWPAAHRRPYWYYFGEQDLKGGAYFGCWCIEAAAVAKAFGVDDSQCLNLTNYPGDLVMDGRSPRYDDSDTNVSLSPKIPSTRQGWWRKLWGSKGA